nr:MAG TPA: hypothetical protein [Bacteriophage sp.]DAF14499.1 MAG TPA: hypothetical protein [Crassvirales sp.]
MEVLTRMGFMTILLRLVECLRMYIMKLKMLTIIIRK